VAVVTSERVGVGVGTPVEASRGRRPAEAAIEELRRLQRTVGEMPRALIVAALRGGPLSVEELAGVIGRPTPATSQHLRVLRELGVVSGRRERSRVFYGLRPGRTTAQALRMLADVEAAVDQDGGRG
jgi:DNA-binding transcriptional ArsR family regulator